LPKHYYYLSCSWISTQKKSSHILLRDPTSMTPIVFRVPLFMLFMSTGWGCLRTVAINGPIFHPPDNKWVWRATMELNWQGTQNISQKNQSLCHFSHQKSHMDWHGREHGPPLSEASD
jgi:hypothetical protein